MAAPIKKIIHRFIYDISEYETGGSQEHKIIPIDTQIYAYYPETYDQEKHGSGLYFVFGDGQHTYVELRDGMGLFPTAGEYGTYNPEEIAELKRLIEQKVPKNPEAVAGTGTKITTDDNGLVIDLTTLSQDDIPSIPLSKISDVLVDASEVNQLDGVTSNVQGQLDTLTQDLATEVVNRSTQYTELDGKITTEATTRAQADTALGERIDTISTNAVKYDVNAGTVDKNNVTLEGTGSGTKITNLAPGTIAEDSKDAINGAQLYTTNTNIQTVADNLDTLEDVVDTKQAQLTSENAGDGISITGEGANIKINNTKISAVWGNLTGNINDQTDLTELINSKVGEETTRATTAETALNTKVEAETTRATAKENELSNGLMTETNLRIMQDNALDDKIEAETTRATTAETTLNTKVEDEKTRAQTAEAELADDLQDEIDARVDMDNTLADSIAAEKTRAEGVEGSLSSLTTDDKASLVGAVNEVDSHTDTNTSDIATINSKIPAQATAQNQLADKEFVNSTVATQTATFRGTYNSVEELEEYSGPKDNNDYAFVIVTDALGNTAYDRYKYDGTNWVFEYELNNSSFTAVQWAAINSKMTESAKNDYDSHLANTVIHVTQSDKDTWSAKQSAITGAATTITSSNLEKNRAVISDNSGKVAVSSITTTELNHLSGVTANIQTQLNARVEKTDGASKVYGTDSSGNQTTYDYNSFGKVDDVKVGNTSVVTNKIANLGTMASETASNYRKASDQDTIDSGLNTAIETETANRETADTTLNTKITNLGNAVGGSFGQDNTYTYTYKVDQETPLVNIADTDKVVKAIGKLDQAIEAEETRATGIEGGLQTSIDTINGKIPSAASSSNKLVDNTTYTTGLGTKVDKTDQANKVYGTDDSGEQTTYGIDSFGKVDDVKIGSNSLVANKIATIPLATGSSVGVASFNGGNGLSVDNNGAVKIEAAAQNDITAKTEDKKPIVPATLDYAIEKGLGSNGLTWTDQEKSSARSTIGAQATITGAATTVTSNNLTANRVVISNNSGKIAVSDITSTELGYLDDATGNIQTQINSLDTNKVTKNDAITAGTATRITYDSKGLVTAGANNLAVSDIKDLTATAAELNVLDGVDISTTELNYLKNASANIQEQITNLSSTLDDEIDERKSTDETYGTYISNLQAVIPTAATAQNQVADKKYVNDLIQSTAADFRGSWDTYADVPSDASLYPEDDTGSTIPNTNDYIIIQRDETQDGGTWRYKYTGVWAVDNKSGWTAEYEINANPLTEDQIAALNSGITDVLVEQISTNADNITSLTNTKQDNITGAASTVTDNNLNPSVVVVTNASGKLTHSTVSTTEVGYLTGVTSNLQTQLNGKQASLDATQMNAVNSGITEQLRQSYDNHLANTNIHVTSQDKINWNAKQEALSETQMAAVDSGITTALREGYDAHLENSGIHITTQERTTWNAKQDAISDLTTIRDGAAAGATAVQDVQINSTSIVNNKTANIPLGSSSAVGVVKSSNSYGIGINNTGTLYTVKASDTQITAKTDQYRPLTPANIDNVVKVGVTTNTNTLTDQEKSDAQTWLGVDTELAKKQDNITGAATTVVSSDLTASRVLISNASGKIAADANITTTELSYLNGVTSNIQTQFSNMDTAKANKATTLAGYGITDAYTKSEVDEKVAGVYIYKGSVATEDDLPASGNRTGDVYNVESDGTNWAWNGTAWDNLGALIDLSTKQDVLVSGENIKTINSNSILGSGNLSLPTTISALTDTTISSLANSQFLVYESSSSKWKNKTVHIPADANNATISIKDTDAVLLGDFTTDQSSDETITLPKATTVKFGLVKVDSALSDTSENPIQNKAIKGALDGKQASLDSNQLAAVNSGVTSATVTQVATNTGAISTINSSAVMNSGITSTLVTTYSSHVSNNNIHVTSDQKTAWTNKQDALVSGTNIKTINNTSILGSGNIDTNPFPAQTGNSGKVLKTNGSAVSWETIGDSGDVIPYAISTTGGSVVEKEVSIPSITSLKAGQVIIVQPTITSTVANSTIKLNDFDAYPMRYGTAAITTSTDSMVWRANYPSWWRFDGSVWQFLGHGVDDNSTYTLNYSIDRGRYTAGTGSYAVTRYSIIAQKANGTWEKITATSSDYSTGTSKSVNTSGFRLNELRYYNTTTGVAAGGLLADNVVYSKASGMDMRYSTNCGDTTNWAVGDYIYLVGTIGNDGLFYFDTTTWWTKTLPSTNDGKLYIRIGVNITANSYSVSLYEDRPVFYHNGTKICEYLVADNKQDKLVSGTNIKTVNGTSLLGSGNIDTLPSQSGNSGKFLSTNGTAASWVAIEEYTAAEVETLWNSITPTAA